MTYEIILGYSTAGTSIDLDCDDEDLFQTLHDDEIFQDELARLVMRFEEMVTLHDTTDD